MSDKQKAMKARLDELRKENAEISNRRAERAKEAIGDVKSFMMTRGAARQSMQGVPREVIFMQKMAIPKKRRKK